MVLLNNLKVGNLYSGHIQVITTGSFAINLNNSLYLGIAQGELSPYTVVNHLFLQDNKIVEIPEISRYSVINLNEVIDVY